jgi:hypothetical protein
LLDVAMGKPVILANEGKAVPVQGMSWEVSRRLTLIMRCGPTDRCYVLLYFLANERTKITMFQRSSGFVRSPSGGI